METVQVSPQRGFADPVHDANAAFRAIMDAMARPGTKQVLSSPAHVPDALHDAAASVLLSLTDFDTTVFLEPALRNDPALKEFIAFNCGAPLTVQADLADFAFAGYGAALPDVSAFAQGTAEYPDRSTTLVLALPEGDESGAAVILRGPGIKGHRALQLPGIDDGFWKSLIANRRGYPLGVDVIFTRGREITCLPRSTRIELASEA
ncbi:phosphonate C-P lyase system protein PhnH [Tepidamorphus sp. 3E244]|uniref:phosphonate C-P lyase system protein PhnH n=1 Tax=Tepidamorphus sp. 3E244 TaxID=3385498 RepID=UPI0038FD26B8